MSTPCTGHAAESERDEYMAEAERLVDEYAEAHDDFILYGISGADKARAALLDHIKRGPTQPADTVPDSYGLMHDRCHTDLPGCRAAKSLKVPMPDTSDIAGYTPQALRDYGAAREAAGYARGMAEADEREAKMLAALDFIERNAANVEQVWRKALDTAKEVRAQKGQTP